MGLFPGQDDKVVATGSGTMESTDEATGEFLEDTVKEV